MFIVQNQAIAAKPTVDGIPEGVYRGRAVSFSHPELVEKSNFPKLENLSFEVIVANGYITVILVPKDPPKNKLNPDMVFIEPVKYLSKESNFIIDSRLINLRFDGKMLYLIEKDDAELTGVVKLFGKARSVRNTAYMNKK